TESKPKGVDTLFRQRSKSCLFENLKKILKIKFYFHDDACQRKHFTTKHDSQDLISLAVYSGGANKEHFPMSTMSCCAASFVWSLGV
ncbi:hypothetical protein IHE44_0009301, partial [Lamprotornis superbus]